MSLTHLTTGHATRNHSLIVKREISKIVHNGRTYKLLETETQDGLPYLCLRLYNAKITSSNNFYLSQFCPLGSPKPF